MRSWLSRLLLAVLLAFGAVSTLSLLEVPHDVGLVTLLAVLAVVAVAVTMDVLEAQAPTRWQAPPERPSAYSGEDTGTSMFRHLVEAHLFAREPDDAVVWMIADLARARLQQVHGLHYADDPGRVVELLGPTVAAWVARDRTQRYAPGSRRHRYTLAELGEAVRRVEQL